MDDQKGWKQQLKDIRDKMKTFATSWQAGNFPRDRVATPGATWKGSNQHQERHQRATLAAKVVPETSLTAQSTPERQSPQITVARGSTAGASKVPNRPTIDSTSVSLPESTTEKLHSPRIKLRAPARTNGAGWQDLGRRTQFYGTERADTLDLIIGLDFGTAFTKVVIGESRARYAVPFDERVETPNPYLLPGVLTADAGGEFHIGEVPGGSECYSDLKISLLKHDRTEERCALIVAYLALVLRHVRAWFLRNLRDVYGRSRINWLINVGLPSDPWHDQQLEDLYKRIAWGAWELSVTPGRVTLDAAKIAYKSYPNGIASDGSLRSPEQIEIIPEFIAQVASYVKSARREEDLHLLVDIGAGTVDVTTFNVHSDDGDDVYPIFAARVLPLGTHFLLNEILVSSERAIEWDDSQPFPSAGVIVERLRLDKERVISTMQSMTHRFVSAVGKVLARTKKRRYRGSPHWMEGIPVFICGGGANIPFYRNALGRLNKPTEYPMRLIQMERPDILKAPGLNAKDFHRLSVAYGLSFDAFDIGRIRPIDDTPDDDPPPAGPSYTDAYVSKDLT